ncbi:MAG: response regulator transcription factor [Polyangiaceae bacterium]|nr:response regulator transcription factor [Polyangiaceae bacterium]
MTTSHEAAATAEAFDVGVVDLELPDGSGLHLAARLSGFGRLRGRVFTASQLESAVARRAAPMGPVVVRGAPAAVLLDAIDRVLAAMDRAAETMRSGVRPSAPVHPWPFASGAAGSKQS